MDTREKPGRTSQKTCVSTMIVFRRSPVARSLGRSLACSVARSLTVLLLDWIASREPQARQGACARHRNACRSHTQCMEDAPGKAAVNSCKRKRQVDRAQALWIAYGAPQRCPRCVPKGLYHLWEKGRTKDKKQKKRRKARRKRTEQARRHKLP